MRSTILVLSILLICSLLAGCGGPAEEVALKVEPTNTTAPPGSPGNPVTSNSDWEPVIEEFDGVEMALVPVGCFMMGSDTGRENEIPAHEQCLDQSFYIDVYEVSNRQYGKEVSNKYLDQPIEYINWYDAAAYCESRGGRLPTEVEWEYAARGPDNLMYTWRSEHVSGIYLVRHLGVGSPNWSPLPVGSKPDGASWVGAQDMIGNVWEWTSSIFSDYPYNISANIGESSSLDENESIVFRGNSCLGEEDFVFRAAYRRTRSPTSTGEGLGFRCVRTE